MLVETNRVVTITISSFSLSLDFAPRPHIGSFVRMDPKKNVGTCPGLPLQLLAQNVFFLSDRPDNFSKIKQGLNNC